MEDPNEGLISRVNEVNKENLEPLPPLKKWLRDIKITSVEEATKDIPIPFIEEEVETAINYAKRKKLELSETNLTVDEITALILYTTEWPKSSGENKSLYFQLNKLLRESNRNTAIPFFKYLVLLLSGLSKIPPLDGMLYRGVKQDLRALYQSKKDKNMTVIWNGLSSSTIKLGVLQDFIGNSGHGTMFHIHSKTARKISDFSVFQKEEEALFFPLSQFQIDSLFVHGDLTMISLHEVDPIENLISLFSNITLLKSPLPTQPSSTPQPIHHIQNKSVKKDEDVRALHEKWSPYVVGSSGDLNWLVKETTIHLQNFPNSFIAFYYRGRANRNLCGYKIVDKSDWNEALNFAMKKKEESPNDVDAHFVIAQFYLYTGEYDKSIQYSSMAIQLNPNYSYAYCSRGNSYRMKGEYDKCIEDCSKSIQLNPNYSLAYYSRGESYRMKGEYDKCIEDCSKSIQLNPNYSDAYYSRGDSYRMKGEYDKCIEDCSKSIQLNPNDSQAYYSRGESYRMKGEYDKCIEDCSKAIQLNPNNEQAYGTRGSSYLSMGNTKAAKLDLEKALKLNPNNLFTKNELKKLNK